jgi:cobalamin biosynthesis Mg chelatase CobN
MPTNYEQQPRSPENDHEALDALGQEHTERLRAKYEKVGEKSPEHEAAGENAKHEALEAAIQHEKPSHKEHETSSPAVRRGSIKSERAASYKRTMTQIQSEMSAPSRAFSKVIHNKAVEKTSEVAGSTVARPNAILAGAIFAFIFTLATYLIAKHYGYQLSGFETIGSFTLGWVAGLLFDYFRIMITGKRSL